MTAEQPRLAHTLNTLSRAGIRLQEGDAARIEAFLARLRTQSPPGRETDPWTLPVTLDWPRG